MIRSVELYDLGAGLPSSKVENYHIGVGKSLLPEEVVKLAAHNDMLHIVQKDSLAFEKELVAAKTMIVEPAKFFNDPIDVIFGNGQYAEGGLDVVSSATDSKKNVLAQLESFLMALNGTRAIRDDAIMVADELFTNGEKNAFHGKLRAEEGVEVQAGIVHFTAKSDGQRLVLCCSDSYGKLDPMKMVHKISDCYKNGVARSINMAESGGAGIGSYMVFNTCMSLYIAVEKGKRTVVCGVLPLSLRLKETVHLPKSLHILVI